MALVEETLFGVHDKVAIALQRLRTFEPQEGYYLAFSGGKDSQCVYHLCKEAGVKFDAHYSLTTVDPPEVIYFMREHYPDVIVDRHDTTMWKLIVKKGMPPTRMVRYCCDELKEGGGRGRIMVTGVRWVESSKRKNNRGLLELNNYTNVHLESMLRELSAQLQQAKGKKVYGYLSQPARNLVNNIVDELAKDDRLSQLYSLWYDQRDAVIRTYQDKMPDRLPLSQNETFRSIKNTVIQEAMNLSADTPAMDTAVDLPEEPAEEIPASVSAVEPEVFTPPAHTDNEPGDEIPLQEEPAPPPKPLQQRTNWWTDAYKQARKFLYGTTEEPPQFEKAYAFARKVDLRIVAGHNVVSSQPGQILGDNQIDRTPLHIIQQLLKSRTVKV